jgi:parallel beta-helix repeat protein
MWCCGILALSLFLVTWPGSADNTIRNMTMSEITDGNINDFQKLSFSYVDHAPISIDGNTEFHTQANAENWDGDGTCNDPYIIYGYRIIGPSNEVLIRIMNTDVCFYITDCLLVNGEDGIFFFNVENGNIANTTVMGNTYSGIWFNVSRQNTIFHTLVNTSSVGIWINDSYNNTISYNTVSTNSDDGVALLGSENNTVSHNHVNFNIDDGIRLSYSTTNTIFQNTINNNLHGIEMEESQDNILSNNILYDHFMGIYLKDSKENVLTGNLAHTSTSHGIFLSSSGNNTISSNIAYNNEYGISPWYSSDDNSLYRNKVYNNTNGFTLIESDNNAIYSNNIHENSVGITLQDSDHNKVSCNNITDSYGHGISILSSVEGNIVKRNNFRGNNPIRGPTENSQGYDDGQNNIISENYWDDWSGSGAYPIDGSATNQDPSPSASPIDIANCIPILTTSGASSIELFTIMLGLTTLVLVTVKRRRIVRISSNSIDR